ncbi:hypothetical protein V2W45_1227489 [Cenococcum geophilum]
MYLFTVLIAFVTLTPKTIAGPMVNSIADSTGNYLAARDPDACFKYNYATKFTCSQRLVPALTANLAIAQACSAITACMPLEGPFVNSSGTAGNLFAKVHIGDQCVMGKTTFTAALCQQYFNQFMNAQCGGSGDNYALGYVTFICDNSTLSISD